MLPYLPLPPLRDVLRVLLGTLVTAAGFAAIAAPAPWGNVLPLPLAVIGAALAVPPLLDWE